MAQLISIKKVVVGPKNLTATVEFSAKAPRLTSENAEATERVLELLPGLSNHLCLGDADARFGLVAEDTEVAHLLEHVTVELLALTNLAGDVASGKTSLVDSRRGLYEIILACPDDVLVAASLSSAVWLLNWAYGNQEDADPDINAIVSGLVALIQSLDGEKTDELADSAEPEADAVPQAESVVAEDYAADNSSEDVADAAAADAVEAEAADAEENNAEVAGIDASDEDAVAPAADADPAADAEPAADIAEAPADELAEATAAEDATDDSEVTDVPDDWNMINVPRPKPVR
ncbi:hypothetical protein HMPREF1647_05945 [Lancefieldella parvula DNF00906]|uniref:cyanophycin synthetase family protein n=1 Tax=Lancefieldella parvula TaxID=1382 RepID=UPI00050E7E45|nr:hypothetical protein [Lancefieldella parvula]KGF13172.1 hypothetical protein HMPREF1647_05945 [Lancefieldella parvula DNF00906]